MLSMLWSNTAMSLLLTVAQFFAVAVGPAGLVRCQDADGWTHVELLSDSCCGSSTPATQALSVAPTDLDGCSQNECDDSLVRAQTTVPGRSLVRLLSSDHSLDTPTLAPAPICLPPLVRAVSPRVDDAVDGLRPIHRALRATVLLL